MDATTLAKGISKALMFVGAVIFISGDRALREIWKFKFVPAEVCGIGGGILLMLLGTAIKSAASRSGSADTEPDSSSGSN